MTARVDNAAADLQQTIAELQRQLTERTAERDAALQRETATTEVLQVINSAPGDLAPVFDAILEKALSLCEAAFGGLQIWDGERLHRVASRGLPAEYVHATASTQGSDRPLAAGSLGERFFRGENLIVIPDLVKSELRPRSPQLEALVTFAGARNYLGIALRKDDRLLGTIGIYRQEVRPFTDKQIALLQNFAAQAVIAIENARLITETREALEQQTATAEVLQVINSSPGDLAPVFDAVLEKALRLCDAAFGFLSTYDGGFFRLAAARGASEELPDIAREPFRVGRGYATTRLAAGEPVVHVADITQLPRTPGTQAMIELGQARTVIWVALRKDNALVGLYTIFRQEVRPFTDKQIALLQNFAAQAVIAIENARLITETREALEQQTATAEVLGVINSSPGDLAPVFDAMIERAVRLCAADNGILRTYDGELFHTAAIRGEAAVVERITKLGPLRMFGLLESIVRGERVVHIVDVQETEIYRAEELVRRRFDLSGVCTYLAVPLQKEGSLLGVITAWRKVVHPLSAKEIALLENFAAQAVIAMENARLLGELRQRTDEVAELNRGLEARVAEQVDELGRVGRLKRFLAPQLAELIVSQGDEKILESHRREIVVVFCDLRGYTAFTETAEPEEVLDFLREYHGALGPLVSQFEGTLDQFSGDGIMVFFNDPVPIPDPAERAVKMAVAMREAAGTLIAAWRRRGRMLGFGAGVAQGYATLGQIGFAERSGYTAIGTVCNLAARLCAEAKDGQILVAQRVAVAVETTTPLEEVGELTLKGLSQPVIAFNVPLTAGQPALRVIEGGPPSS